MLNKLNIALVGAGYWGKNLVRVFSQLNVLKTICDLDKEILAARKKEYPSLETTTNFSELLEDKEITAVVISAPAVTHYRLAKEALLKGKDVFVEKPLALRVSDGEELVRLAQKNRNILMVGHLLLYHPAIIKLKETIKNGELGDIRYIWSNRLNLGKLRKEENVLWSFAPHDISVIIDILGTPEKVIAIGKAYLQKNIPDITLTSLDFREGKSAHIFVSWLNPFKEQKLSVIGSKAMAVFDGVKNKLSIYPYEIKQQENRSPEAIRAATKVISFLPKEPLLEEGKHFLRCIETRETPRTNGEEALEVLKVLDACQRSLERAGKPTKPAT